MNNRTCTIKLLDEVNCVIIGLSEDDVKFFYKKYGILAKNYFYNPKFKLKRWDGYIRFFTENSRTYVRLIPELYPDIKKRGYKINIIDNRKKYLFNIPPIDKNYFGDYGIELGQHQVDAINAVLSANSGLLEAGTGSGKTYCNAAICDIYNKKYNFRTLTIVPTTDLVQQTIESFQKLNLDTGEYSGSKKDLNHSHIVCTWQSVINNPELMRLFQLVVCDEAHAATGKSLQKLLNEYGSHIVVRIGLTGTVPLHPCDAMVIKVTLGDVLYKIPASELIKTGWLSDVLIKIYVLHEHLKDEWEKFNSVNPTDAAKTNYKSFRTEVFPDYTSEKTYLINKQIRAAFIASFIQASRTSKKGNCLVLVNSIKTGQKLQKEIPGSHFVDGTDAVKIRKEIYSFFDSNDDIVVIATYKLASTGLNIPRIFNLFMIDAGKSFTTIIQSIGRGLRKAHDKDFLNVYDICGDLKYSSRHMNERIKYYKSQGYKFVKKIVEYL